MFDRTPCRLARPLRHGQYRFQQPLRSLAAFDGYGPEARTMALRYFGGSIWEIESILRRPSPDAELRDDLALMLWNYALDVAGKTGDDPIRLAETNHYLKRLKKQMHQLRATLSRRQ
jgi:hypothetical protein